MESNNMSPAKVAQIIGIQRDYIRKIAYHNQSMSPAMAARISEATKGEVSVIELLFPKNQEAPPPRPGVKKKNGRV
jgi:DNA-binding transcriptional regulator YdaS (Cro superfamily)